MMVAAGALAALVIASSGTGGFMQVAGNPAVPEPAEVPAIGGMILERQFHGPLKDTVVQRYRDPVDGTVCYVYLPVLVPHAPPAAGGMVQYGANGIGSISCLLPR